MTGNLAVYYKEVELDSNELYVDDSTPVPTKGSAESTTTDSTLVGSARTKSTSSSGNNTLNPTTNATLAGGASAVPPAPMEFYDSHQQPGWRRADRKEAAQLRGHERSAAVSRGKKSAFTEATDDDRPPASPIPKTPAEYYGRAVDLLPPGDSLQVPPAVPAAPTRLAPPPPPVPQTPASPIPQTPLEYYGGGGRGLPRLPPPLLPPTKEKRQRNDKRGGASDGLRVPGAKPARGADDPDAIMPASPIQQTPIEFYGRRRAFQWPPAAAAGGSTAMSSSTTTGGTTMAATSMTVAATSAERGWVGRAPDVPEMTLTPPTPMGPTGAVAADGRPMIINEKRPPTKKGRR
jgi:hypothetical protein